MQYEYDLKVGVISDTHGVVRPQVIEAFAGVDMIVHAGDVGGRDVLETLGSIAPVHPVCGNIDHGGWWAAHSLPSTDVVEAGGLLLYVLHDIETLDTEPAAAGISVVISGHSHVPCMERRDGVIFLNPGSAGPVRLDLPVSVAFIYIKAASVDAELVELCSG